MGHGRRQPWSVSGQAGGSEEADGQSFWAEGSGLHLMKAAVGALLMEEPGAIWLHLPRSRMGQGPLG